MIVDPSIVIDDALQYRASSELIAFHLMKRTLSCNLDSLREQELSVPRVSTWFSKPSSNPSSHPLSKRSSKPLLPVLQAQGNLPGLSMAREQVQRDLGQAEAEHKSHVAAMEELKMEMDVHMNAYLKQENVGKEKAAVVQASFMEVRILKARS
jgi:hypothetical protein